MDISLSITINGHMLYNKGWIEVEFKSAHEILMNLNSTFTKSMNLILIFAKSMNWNLKVLIKHSMNLIFSNQNLRCESSDL